jgi:hypothetical protein
VAHGAGAGEFKTTSSDAFLVRTRALNAWADKPPTLPETNVSG